MAKLTLLTAKSKTGFQSFSLAIRYWEMIPDNVAYQISVEML